MLYNGIEIIVNDSVCRKNVREFFNYPRTRKKRIIKKWKKRECNWRDKKDAFEHRCFHLKEQNIMLVSTDTLKALQRNNGGRM